MPQSVLGKVFTCLTLQFIVGHYIVFVTSEETIDHVKKLWQDIFTKGSYNKFTRPVKDHNTPVFVETRLNLVGIMEINVVEENLTTTASVSLNWNDDNLVWDPDLYGGEAKGNIS
ncbi:Acetylcholine receptor subunit alpha-1-A [Mizuhopecten yessoensis]|uniref:Acetylcholine receptor subunit alpha-1-A n=1 Tax=Mizuhopecten yessoensis TaxID=6573 RepID=A0A210QRA7_MIZYE|nr:Acetylcholine receptor subunit alpha-1-A [Mizuhopecten yessoensis]